MALWDNEGDGGDGRRVMGRWEGDGGDGRRVMGRWEGDGEMGG